MTKIRLAAIIAAMFAVPAGVVATGQSASSPEAAEMSTPIQSAATVEPVAGAEQAPTETAIGVAPVEPAIPVVDRVRNIIHSERVVVAPYQDEPGNVLLPRQLAYLERLEAQRGQMIARNDAFPASNSPDDAAPLPAQLAYFERLDQTRIAALQPRQVASAESSVPGSGEPITLAEASPAR